MTKFENTSSFSRRSVLLGGGALVVSVGAADLARHLAVHATGLRARRQAASDA